MQVPMLLTAVIAIYSGALAKERWRDKRIIAIIYLAMCVIACGVVLKLMVTNYLHYNYRAKESEAKKELRKISRLERSFFQENDEYAESLEELGWAPAGTTRYAYSLNDEELEGMDIEIPEGGFFAVAIANIDTDGFLDAWVADHRNRVIHVYDDFTHETVDPNETLSMTKAEYQKAKTGKWVAEFIRTLVLLSPLILFCFLEPLLSRKKGKPPPRIPVRGRPGNKR